MPLLHASCLVMLESVMTMNGGAEIYSPGGNLGGGRPADSRASSPRSRYSPRRARKRARARSVKAAQARRGARRSGHRGGPAAYEARWSGPVEAEFAVEIRTRGGLSSSRERSRGSPSCEASAIRARPRFRRRAPRRCPRTTTTNISAVDADGSACVLTTSLGLGSGDFVPGFDLHLNSMLGEADLLVGDLEPGERMAEHDGAVARARRRRPRALRLAGGNETPVRAAGRRRDPRRGPRAPDGRRPAARPPGTAVLNARAGLRPGGDSRSWRPRAGSNPLAGTIPTTIWGVSAVTRTPPPILGATARPWSRQA